MVNEKNSLSTIIRTVAHELGHSAGLYHPFSENNNIPEISNQQNLGPLKDGRAVRDNLMNSEANPIYPSNNGKTLIPKQREKIRETVTNEQPKSQ